jgi:hypothetical protein
MMGWGVSDAHIAVYVATSAAGKPFLTKPQAMLPSVSMTLCIYLACLSQVPSAVLSYILHTVIVSS